MFEEFSDFGDEIDCEKNEICQVLLDAVERLERMHGRIVKLAKLLEPVESTPSVSEEWGSGWRGTNFLVEIEETGNVGNSAEYANNGSHEIALNNSVADVLSNVTRVVEAGPKIIVRTEEIFIVALVLMLWAGAIVLFFNRWGKIRMLEPYQPKFQQEPQHRASCPHDTDSSQTHPRASISRMSMCVVNNLTLPHFPNAGLYSPGPYARPRLNSVFVGPSINQISMPRAPRKTRSAMDLHSLTLDETGEAV